MVVRALYACSREMHESPRAFTRVYECWTDCLNQDLPDAWGFSGWQSASWLGNGERCMRVHLTRVHERFRVLDRLSESGFSIPGESECLLDWEWSYDVSHTRAFTSVYERWTDCLNQDLPDFWGFSGWRVPPGSGMVVRALYACSREMTRVHERLREFASVSLAFIDVSCDDRSLDSDS